MLPQCFRSTITYSLLLTDNPLLDSPPPARILSQETAHSSIIALVLVLLRPTLCTLSPTLWPTLHSRCSVCITAVILAGVILSTSPEKPKDFTSSQLEYPVTIFSSYTTVKRDPSIPTYSSFSLSRLLNLFAPIHRSSITHKKLPTLLPTTKAQTPGIIYHAIGDHGSYPTPCSHPFRY